jgi:hypothetical protein
MSSLTATPGSAWSSRWQRFAATVVRAFHVYGSWLVSITWWRFGLLSVLLIVIANILQSLPPFTWTYTETVVENPGPVFGPRPPKLPKAPERATPREQPGVHIGPSASGAGRHEGVDISIDHSGVRINSRGAAASAADAASAAASAASSSGFSVKINGEPVVEINAGDQDVRVAVPPGANSQEVRDAVEEAKQAVIEAIEDAKQAREDAAQARDDIEEALNIGPRVSHRKVQYGESLPQLAVLWVLLSGLLKATYKARMQAEKKAAEAT